MVMIINLKDNFKKIVTSLLKQNKNFFKTKLGIDCKN